MERHLGKTGKDVEWLADRLMSHGVLNGFSYEVREKPKAVQALDRIDRALMELGRACSSAAIDDATWHQLIAAIMFGEFLEHPNPDRQKARDFIESVGEARGLALIEITRNSSPFRDAVRTVKSRVQEDPKAVRSLSQMNVEAIGLVGGCRWVWENATGKPGPSKDLNPASKFAAFLADAMGAVGIEGEPRPAFLAWARYQSKIHRSAE